ncbi:MAG: hypothetical protein ACTSRP_14370 [Candidatus Helarchaeota archaeon]
MNDIQELLSEYHILMNRIQDLEEALSIKRGPNQLLLMVKKDETEKPKQDDLYLPDPRLIEFKKERFNEKLLMVKRELFKILKNFTEKLGEQISNLDEKNDEMVIIYKDELRFGRDYWKFIAECFKNEYPLEVFDCIFDENQVKINIKRSNGTDTKKILKYALEFLRFMSEVESGESEAEAIVRMNWELLMRSTLQNNLYGKIFRNIGIIGKPINILDFCKSVRITEDKIRECTNELSAFSPHTGLKFPVLKELEKDVYFMNCYGKYLWGKFGFIINK